MNLYAITQPHFPSDFFHIESLLLCVKNGLGVAILDSNIRLYNRDRFKLFEIEGKTQSVKIAWKKDNQDEIVHYFTHDVLEKIKKTIPESIDLP